MFSMFTWLMFISFFTRLHGQEKPISVIVMTFWYVLSEQTYFFLNFLNFLLGIDHDPHVLYVHMTYVYSFLLCFILHAIIWPREVIIVLWSFRLRSTNLWTHPHPHFLLLPPQTHHPYTPRLCRSTTAPPGEGYHPVAKYGYQEDPGYTSEDSRHSRLGIAKVVWVLPSRKSAQPDGWCCREPLPD